MAGHLKRVGYNSMKHGTIRLHTGLQIAQGMLFQNMIARTRCLVKLYKGYQLIAQVHYEMKSSSKL